MHDDTVPANFDIALMSNANGTDNANFNAFPGWTVVSPVVLTINEAATPTFILQRSADGVYYQLDLGFTVLDASFTVQIDSLQAWRCGVNPTDCP